MATSGKMVMEWQTDVFLQALYVTPHPMILGSVKGPYPSCAGQLHSSEQTMAGLHVKCLLFLSDLF